MFLKHARRFVGKYRSEAACSSGDCPDDTEGFCLLRSADSTSSTFERETYDRDDMPDDDSGLGKSMRQQMETGTFSSCIGVLVEGEEDLHHEDGPLYSCGERRDDTEESCLLRSSEDSSTSSSLEPEKYDREDTPNDYGFDELMYQQLEKGTFWSGIGVLVAAEEDLHQQEGPRNDTDESCLFNEWMYQQLETSKFWSGIGVFVAAKEALNHEEGPRVDTDESCLFDELMYQQLETGTFWSGIGVFVAAEEDLHQQEGLRDDIEKSCLFDELMYQQLETGTFWSGIGVLVAAEEDLPQQEGPVPCDSDGDQVKRPMDQAEKVRRYIDIGIGGDSDSCPSSSDVESDISIDSYFGRESMWDSVKGPCFSPQGSDLTEEVVRVPVVPNPTEKKENRSSKTLQFVSPGVSDNVPYDESDIFFAVGSRENMSSMILPAIKNQDEVPTKVVRTFQMMSVNKFLQEEDQESYVCVTHRLAMQVISTITSLLSCFKSLYVIERPRRWFSSAYLNACFHLASEYLILNKLESATDEVVCEESAHSDSVLDASSNLSSSSKDSVNDSEETICTAEIIWHRIISCSTKMNAISNETVNDESSSYVCVTHRLAMQVIATITSLISCFKSLNIIERPRRWFSRAYLNACFRLASEYLILNKLESSPDEVVCEESAHSDSVFDASSSLASSSKDSVNDSEETSCTAEIIWRRIISCSTKRNAISNETVNDEWSSYVRVTHRLVMLVIATITSLLSCFKSLYVIERPRRWFSRAYLNASFRLASEYLILNKLDPSTDEVVCEESAHGDSVLDASSILSSSSKDSVNDSEETNCPQEITWRRIISCSTKMNAISNETVNDESSPNCNEIDDASTIFKKSTGNLEATDS